MNLSKFKHDSIEALKSIDVEIVQEIVEAIKETAITLVFGNGGSATTASHFALDCTKNAGFNGVFCLNDSTASITAYANDTDYSHIFELQILNFLNRGLGMIPNIGEVRLANYSDISVIGISTSGNSQNVIKGMDISSKMGCQTIVLTGFDGGDLAEMACNIHLHINSDVIEAVEDAHLAVLHMVVRGLKDG